MSVVPPQRRRRMPRAVLIAIIGVGALGFLLVAGLIGVAIWGHAKADRDIRYEVTGSAKNVTIIYRADVDEHADTHDETLRGSTLPWSTSYHTKWMIASARVQVLRAEDDAGSISCTISIDGQVVSREVSKPTDRTIVCLEPDH